jgi:divalent metal cation (Fe/Co/Zn/Cd) transporter
MLISAIVNITILKMLFTVARETDSIVLEADAWHLRTDVYTPQPFAYFNQPPTLAQSRHSHWLDPVAAIAVALLIISQASAIHGFHHLRARKAGNLRFVDFHIKVAPKMSVEDSHKITDDLSESVQKQFPGASVTIHTEPCNGNCIGGCLSGCLMPEDIRKRIIKYKESDTRS